MKTIDSIRADVALATVKLPTRGGQGVLVANGFIITAAHCLDYDQDVGIGIALGGHIHYKVETRQGVIHRLAPYVIEPCSDIAVLGPLDNQVFEEAEDFETFCEQTRPVSLYRGRLYDLPEEFGIHIFTHNKGWVTGKAQVTRNYSPTVFIKADENIDGGTSGGPIINDAGELVGVISISGGSERDHKEGPSPLARWSLPEWIYREICGRGPTASYRAWCRKKIAAKKAEQRQKEESHASV